MTEPRNQSKSVQFGGGEQAFQQSLTLVKPKDGGEWQVSNMGTAYDYIDPEYQDELPPGVDKF